MAYTLQEYCDTNDDSFTNIYGVQQRGQTITSTSGFSLTRVAILAYRIGAPGAFQLGIYAVDGAHKPTGATLGGAAVSASSWTTNSAGAWYTIDLDSAVALSAATEYAIVITLAAGDASNQVLWRLDGGATSYAPGGQLYSTDSGSSWTWLTNKDMMFRTYSGMGFTPPVSSTIARSAKGHLVAAAENAIWFEDV